MVLNKYVITNEITTKQSNLNVERALRLRILVRNDLAFIKITCPEWNDLHSGHYEILTR